MTWWQWFLQWLRWLWDGTLPAVQLKLTFAPLGSTQGPTMPASFSYDTTVKATLTALDKNGKPADVPDGATWSTVDPATGITETIASDNLSAVFAAIGPAAPITVTVTDGSLTVSDTLTFTGLAAASLVLTFAPVTPPPPPPAGP